MLYHIMMMYTVRQLEQQVKTILDSIAVSEQKKKELIRGDAVDKAEQLSECTLYIIHVYTSVCMLLLDCQ